MWKKRRTSRDERRGRVELSDELSWRVHENAKSWIVQVDSKATAALAIEAAVLGFTLVFITNSDALARLTPLSRWILSSASLFLLVSITLSTLVLLPRIKLREPPAKGQSFLYFGHLRHWTKGELGPTLAENKVNDDEIADQVIKMSQIAWRKHVLLQWSLYTLLAGVFVIGCLYLVLIVDLFPQIFGTITDAAYGVRGTTCP